MKKNFLFILIILTLTAGCDNNSTLSYGKTGLPRNCRAIIKENIDGYRKGKFSAEDALDSINRNCGEFGYSWGLH
ncbi:MAG: kynureninase [Alphaproteobacteria bacterium]